MLINKYLYFFLFTSFITISQSDMKSFDPKLATERMELLNKNSPIDFSYNIEVEKYIKDYLFRNRETVSELIALSDFYFPIFEEALDRNNLPLELKYLPIIESELNPKARSSMGATGIWQIMFNTAKEYNLLVSSYVDERMDVEKSTVAACKYFEKSFKRFGDWTSSIASYNVGQYGVVKAIKRSGGKSNYWQYRSFLPPETQKYIPKFFAAAYVINYAHLYGIEPKKNVNNIFHQTDTIHLNYRLNLEILSGLINIDQTTLSKLNPSYKLNIIPHVNERNYYLRLPFEYLEYYLENENQIRSKLLEFESDFDYPLYEELVKTIVHSVKSGDYLGKIANMYNCKVQDILIWNDKKTTKIKIGEKLKIYVNADF